MVQYNFKKFQKNKPKLRVKEGEKYLWPLFHDHHYMTSNQSIIDSLPRSSKFFTFYWVRNNKEILIGCLGVLNQVSKYPARRITRMVILPEYQGLGFAPLMLNSISELYKKQGITMYITTFHPRLGKFFENSEQWEASANNMKSFKTLKEKDLSTDISEHPFEESLRDGVAMYRYHYVGWSNYTLDYNPLILEDLLEQAKNLDDNDKEYKKIKRKIQEKILKEKKKKDPNYKEGKPESLSVLDPNHIRAKEEHRALFGKNKRKVLSPEERKKRKQELKKLKMLKESKEVKHNKKDFDEF